MHIDPHLTRILHEFNQAMDELKKHDRTHGFSKKERSMLQRLVDKLKRK